MALASSVPWWWMCSGRNPAFSYASLRVAFSSEVGRGFTRVEELAFGSVGEGSEVRFVAWLVLGTLVNAAGADFTLRRAVRSVGVRAVVGRLRRSVEEEREEVSDEEADRVEEGEWVSRLRDMVGFEDNVDRDAGYEGLMGC